MRKLLIFDIVGVVFILFCCCWSLTSSESLDVVIGGRSQNQQYGVDVTANTLDWFDNEDLIEFVKRLECQVVEDEDKIHNNGSSSLSSSCYLPVSKVSGVLEDDDDDEEGDEDVLDETDIDNIGNSTTTNATTITNRTLLTSLEEDIEEDENDDFDELDEDTSVSNTDILLPRDLSELREEVSDDVTAGVEESLRMFGGKLNQAYINETDDIPETRQLPMYLFQGQYTPEPRLNRFIDGAVRNMGNEVRISSMDPIYFRVMPRGQVQERQRVQRVRRVNRNRRHGMGRKRRKKRTSSLEIEDDVEGRGLLSNFNLNPFNRRKALLLKRARLKAARVRAKKRRQRLNKLNNNGSLVVRKGVGVRGGVGVGGNRRNRRRNQILRNKRIRLANAKKNKKKANAAVAANNANKNRLKRFAKKNVGGGKIEGISKVIRDGDAEMQLFGNYTLIRSHMKIGPVDLTMQFRTKRGIRRTGATLPVLRAHTVTRVNHEGSEMVDFLLDRPHPETIQLRGNLFPLARKIARNVFARLFLPESFLIQRIRQKTGLALLSRPTFAGDNYSTRHEDLIL